MKSFVIFLVAVFLAWSAQPGGAAKQSKAAAEPLGDGVYLFRHGAHRSLFIVGDAGVIVTDPINTEVAAEYRQAIAAITPQPVRYVVYSHYHWDRIAGAAVFTRDGAEVVAAQRCAQRLQDNPNPAVETPELIFNQQQTLTVGSHSLELYDFGPVHSDCLTVFVARPANILQLVDVVNPPAAAFPDNPLASYIRPHNLERFFSATNALIDRLDIEQVAAWQAQPSAETESGWSPAIGTVDIVQAQAEFWRLMDTTASQAAAEGRVGIDSFVRLQKEELAAFEPYPGFDSKTLPLILRRFTGYHDMGR